MEIDERETNFKKIKRKEENENKEEKMDIDFIKNENEGKGGGGRGGGGEEEEESVLFRILVTFPTSYDFDVALRRHWARHDVKLAIARQESFPLSAIQIEEAEELWESVDALLIARQKKENNKNSNNVAFLKIRIVDTFWNRIENE